MNDIETMDTQDIQAKIAQLQKVVNNSKGEEEQTPTFEQMVIEPETEVIVVDEEPIEEFTEEPIEIQESIPESITIQEDNEFERGENEKEEDYLIRMIPLWKSIYSKVFVTIVDDEKYIWHPLKRSDYNSIEKFIDEVKQSNPIPETKEEEKEAFVKLMLLKNDSFVLETTLYPDREEMTKRLEMYGGLSDNLSEGVLLKSGFHSTSTCEL